MQPVAPAGPCGGFAARDVLPRHPTARPLSGSARIGCVVDDEDVADEALHLGRDVGIARIHRKTMDTDAAGLLIGDQLRPFRIGDVVDLESAIAVALRAGRFERTQILLVDAHPGGDLGGRRFAPQPRGELAACGRQLLGAPPDAAHVALVVDDHDVADDANLVAVRVRIVKLDVCDHARMNRICHVDDGGAEPVLVGDVAHIGVMARNRHLTGARNIEMREAANVVRQCAGVGLVRSLAHQSSRPPAACTTARHLGISALMVAANSAGDEPAISTPRSPSALRVAGSFSAVTVARCSASTIALGVPAGATSPCQVVASKPARPSSATVGISGSTAVRAGVVTASGRTNPSLTWPTTEAAVANIIWTCPAITSCSAGAAPL